MAPSQPRTMGSNDNELWFSLPSSSRQEQEQTRVPRLDQSAYQATSSRRHRSASPGHLGSVPQITTTSSVDKPLPPSPQSERKRRRPGLLSLVRRRPSDESDRSHLQPGSTQRQRSSSANTHLSPEPYQYYYYQQTSRSMPTSPSGFARRSHQPPTMERAHSSAANYSPANYSDYTQFQSYPQQSTRSQRTASTSSHFEQPRTRRTFPETPTSPSANSSRQRPHTWQSRDSNEPFHDASEFHLFVEATSGLPAGNMDFSAFSPTSPPRLQGSHFSRRHQNDRIPIPIPQQNSYAAQPSRSPPDTHGWQSLGYDYMSSNSSSADSPLVSSSALPRRHSHQPSSLAPNVNAINMELERLGLGDESEPEEELPDYAQSQAEMSARRRREATDRARELEARWRGGRGR